MLNVVPSPRSREVGNSHSQQGEGGTNAHTYVQDGVGGLMILQETIDDGERNVCSRERERGRD